MYSNSMRLYVSYCVCYFSLAEKVESGYLRVKLKYKTAWGLIPVYDRKYDICSGAGLTCPAEGQTEIKYSKKIGKFTPRVSY